MMMLLLIGIVVLTLFGGAILFFDQAQGIEKRKSKVKPVDWVKSLEEEVEIPQNALHDQGLKYFIEQGDLIRAMETYQVLTKSNHQAARTAVFYLARLAKAKGRLSVDTHGAGIQDLIDEGRMEEAVQAYRVFMGVDHFTAQAAVERLAGDS